MKVNQLKRSFVRKIARDTVQTIEGRTLLVSTSKMRPLDKYHTFLTELQLGLYSLKSQRMRVYTTLNKDRVTSAVNKVLIYRFLSLQSLQYLSLHSLHS